LVDRLMGCLGGRDFRKWGEANRIGRNRESVLLKSASDKRAALHTASNALGASIVRRHAHFAWTHHIISYHPMTCVVIEFGLGNHAGHGMTPGIDSTMDKHQRKKHSRVSVGIKQGTSG